MVKPSNEQAIHVALGCDRHGEHELLIWGIVPLSVKVAARDTGGAMFVFEHRGMGKGGPPRHVHHNQDEWFYVVEGEFAFEVGEKKFTLRAGDSVLAPRKVPHVWAHVGEGRGTILIAMTPAGTFEAFIVGQARLTSLPSPAEMAAAFEAHDMTVVGPPLLH